MFGNHRAIAFKNCFEDGGKFVLGPGRRHGHLLGGAPRAFLSPPVKAVEGVIATTVTRVLTPGNLPRDLGLPQYFLRAIGLPTARLPLAG